MSMSMALEGATPPSLASLVEDLLIQITRFLEPPCITTLSNTCRRLHDLYALRIIWTNAYKYHILAYGYVFPPTPPITDMPVAELRAHVLHGWRLSKRWADASSWRLKSRIDENETANDFPPRREIFVEQTAGTSVSNVRFLPSLNCGDHHFVATLGKSVWSVLSIWRVSQTKASTIRIAEWGPRGAIFTGFVVNDVHGSDATMAISFQLHEEYLVKLLSLHCQHGSVTKASKLTEIHTIRTSLVPKVLSGDILVLADDDSRVEVWNWKAGTYAILENLDGQGTIQTNECLQVFLYQDADSIIVARARSIYIFPWPQLTSDVDPDVYRPLASHSFGWVDGMSISTCAPPGSPMHTESSSCSMYSPFSILVRGESDDPWTSDMQRLEVWTLSPNPEYLALQRQTSSPGYAAVISEPEHNSVISVPSASHATVVQPSVSISPPTVAPHTHDHPLSSIPAPSSPSSEPPPWTCPYIFPPRLTTTIPCFHGALRCKHVALGQFGTAVWIRPPARQGWGTSDWEHASMYAGSTNFGLTVLTEDVSSAGGGNGMLASVLGSRRTAGGGRGAADVYAESEVLVGVSLNGLWTNDAGKGDGDRGFVHGGFGILPEAPEEVRSVQIFPNDAATSWSAFDYDEIGGRVVLASSFGRLVVLEL